MASQQQNNVPKKGDIIINPKTSRPIRLGSRTWLKLVKEGVVEGRYEDPKELASLPEQYEELPPPEQERVIEEKIEEVNRTLPKNVQAVRGRGRYKGKIVKRNKRLATDEISKYTAEVATRAVAKNIDRLAECEYNDIEGMLEKMILEEMMGGNDDQTRTQTPPNFYGKYKSKTKKEKYEEVEPEEYDYEEANFSDTSETFNDEEDQWEY
tara:strand:+ start:894 stop:1523 length:630 start_codon:yes stop_codon:yes gene_type:complete